MGIYLSTPPPRGKRKFGPSTRLSKQERIERTEEELRRKQRVQSLEMAREVKRQKAAERAEKVAEAKASVEE